MLCYAMLRYAMLCYAMLCILALAKKYITLLFLTFRDDEIPLRARDGKMIIKNFNASVHSYTSSRSSRAHLRIQSCRGDNLFSIVLSFLYSEVSPVSS